MTNIDINNNQEADFNFLIDPTNEIGEEAKNKLTPQLKNLKSKYNAIICTAGGWTGGEIKDENVFESVNKMHKVCTLSALLTAHLSCHFLDDKGLLVFTGSAAVYDKP